VNLSLYNLYQCIDKLYKKRILLVRDFINPARTMPVLSSYAIRYDTIVVNVPSLLEKAAKDLKYAK